MASETIREFAAEMAQRGEPDVVGWADDREHPRLDGVQLARRVDGGVQITLWERGVESDHRWYPDEAEAVKALREREDRLRRQREQATPIDPETLAEIERRMQAKAQEYLQDLQRIRDEQSG